MKRWSSFVNPSVFAVSFVTAFAGLTELAGTAARIGSGDAKGVASRPAGDVSPSAVEPSDLRGAFGFGLVPPQIERAGYADSGATEASSADVDGGGPVHDLQLVLEAQEALQRRGFDVGTVDGILGPRTESALRHFQAQYGLARSGRLDRQTLAALEKDAGGSTGTAGEEFH